MASTSKVPKISSNATDTTPVAERNSPSKDFPNTQRGDFGMKNNSSVSPHLLLSYFFHVRLS